MKSYNLNKNFTGIKLFKSQFTKLYYVLFRLKCTPTELLQIDELGYSINKINLHLILFYHTCRIYYYTIINSII